MMKRTKSKAVPAILALSIISMASACAGTTTTASTDTPTGANRSTLWDDGVKAVETGEAMVSKGERRLELGRQQVREGEAKIRSGSERAERAKQDYERVANSAEVNKQEQARALREIGLRWEAALQEIKDGNRLVTRGNSNMDGGEADIREGLSLMETGSILIRNAHRSRLGLSLLPLPKS